MMTNTKWLRRALLGGVALSVMATGAQADELTELKSQLEALQSRVNQLEQQPQTPALPEGASFLTLTRGSAQMPNYGTQLEARDDYPAERGFTISVTPTADLPAPVAEVVVYGFVKGDVIVDFDKDLGNTFFVPGALSSDDDDDIHFRMHAYQSRFGIDSRVDTAIGQIRTKIEGDFFGSFPADEFLGGFRLRHAYGEWDMTPNWTLLIGQTWSTGAPTKGLSTVDFAGMAGAWGAPRQPQVRLTYHAGPISWAVAAESPSLTSDAEWPNFAGYVAYDIPGGHSLLVTGVVGDETGDGHDIGWAVTAGAAINLADVATFTIGGLYGEGEHCRYLNQDPAGCSGTPYSYQEHAPENLTPNIFLPEPEEFIVGDFLGDRGWGITTGLGFNINETTTANISYGLTRVENDLSTDVVDHVDVHTVHGNILWQPVAQMRLGWEVMWGRISVDTGPDFDSDLETEEDVLRAQFGAWFFF